MGRKLVDFDVDLTRFYLAAESAGAYLSTYAAAMKNSALLQKAIGYQPPKMRFRAMALISGMFYTTRRDQVGRFLSRSYYGNDIRSKRMAKFTNPENPEIINNIPPCYLVCYEQGGYAGAVYPRLRGRAGQQGQRAFSAAHGQR